MIKKFEAIELFGKPMLFTNSRIDRATVPDGWYCYDVRGSDYDFNEPATLEMRVIANHAGTVLSPEEIPFPDGQDYIPITGEINYTGDSMTISKFCKRHQRPVPALVTSLLKAHNKKNGRHTHAR